jgi:ketosteroid isomerase-like protein
MNLTPQNTPPVSDELSIRAIPENFLHYYEVRDVDNLLTLYSDDGRILAPFRPMAEGKSGLRHTFNLSFAQYDPKDLKLVTIYVEVCGHVGFGYGTYQMNIKLPSGKRIDDHGKWMASLRRVGTTWKMVAQSWNTDLSPATFMS